MLCFRIKSKLWKWCGIFDVECVKIPITKLSEKSVESHAHAGLLHTPKRLQATVKAINKLHKINQTKRKYEK